MASLPSPDLSAADLAMLSAAFGLPEPVRIVGPGAGTASQAVVVVSGGERFYLKRRNPRYCAKEWIVYDAELACHLEAAGLPVAPPLCGRDGRPWVESGGHVYQVSRLLGGARVDTPSLDQLRAVGTLLRRWHETTATWRPSVRKPVGRLHDPADAALWLDALLQRAAGEEARVLHRALDWTARVSEAVPDQVYWDLPLVLVQGDMHPGNVHFDDSHVVGVFDYDWACEAPRLTDLVDALIYMAGLRPTPLRERDIRSLTQSFRLEPGRVRALLDGYGDGLTAPEACALSWLLLARWLHSRADAARRKIPEAERVAYVADRLLDPIGEIHALGIEVAGRGLW